jgi:hypothetical protein
LAQNGRICCLTRLGRVHTQPLKEPDPKAYVTLIITNKGPLSTTAASPIPMFRELIIAGLMKSSTVDHVTASS